MNYAAKMKSAGRLGSPALVLICALGFTAQALASTGDAAFVSGSYTVDPNSADTADTFSAAGIQNTTSNTTSGSLGLELWYSPTPFSGGTISGYKVSSAFLPVGNCTSSQLAPGASCTDIVDTVPLTVPPDGTYYPVLLLVEYNTSCTTNGGYCYDDFEDMTNVATGGPTVTVGSGGGSGGSSSGGGGGSSSGGGSGPVGDAEFSEDATVSISGIDWNADTVSIAVSGITNPTSNTSGSISIQLWFTTSPYVQGEGIASGYKVASFALPSTCGPAGSDEAQLSPNTTCGPINSGNIPVTPPPAGTYYAVVLVDEYSSSCTSNGGYCIDDGLQLENQETVPSSAGGGGGFGINTLAALALLALLRIRGRRPDWMTG